MNHEHQAVTAHESKLPAQSHPPNSDDEIDRSDSMDELCAQLKAFHISARAQRVADEAVQREEMGAQSRVGSERDEDWLTTSEGSEGEGLDAQSRVESERDEDWTTTSEGSTSERSGGSESEPEPEPWKPSPLPIPAPGRRPCWEPPVLDYSFLETVIAAQKEFENKKGGKDIEWRTEMMDNFVEFILRSKYIASIWSQSDNAPGSGNAQELSFWSGLRREVYKDWYVVGDEDEIINARHGKTRKDWTDLANEIDAIIEEKDPTMPYRLGTWTLANPIVMQTNSRME